MSHTSGELIFLPLIVLFMTDDHCMLQYRTSVVAEVSSTQRQKKMRFFMKSSHLCSGGADASTGMF
jgi:hypothetical protein